MYLEKQKKNNIKFSSQLKINVNSGIDFEAVNITHLI